MSASAYPLSGDDFLDNGDASDEAVSFTLGDLLTIQADTRPAAPFLRGNGEKPVSYSFAQAHDQVSRLSAFLQTLAVPKGSLIGLVMPNQPTAVIALLACMEAGYSPLLLPAHLQFSVLASLIQNAACASIITDDFIDKPLNDLAVRLAITCEDVRYVMSFGEPANGVISLAQAMRTAPVSTSIVGNATTIYVCGTAHRAEPLSIDALIAAGTEHAAESNLQAGQRILSPVPLTNMHALSCGLISALMIGAELCLLDAPNSSALTTALMAGSPFHLLWPGALEDMLDDIPARAFEAVTIFHKTPWERHRHRVMTRQSPGPCVDAWNFSNRLLAFAQRHSSGSPSLPSFGDMATHPIQPRAVTLSANAQGQVFAAGRAVNGYTGQGWMDLSCKLFRDQDSHIVAIETTSMLKV